MFRTYRPILRRIHTAVHTTIGSVAVLFGPRKIETVTSVGFSFHMLERVINLKWILHMMIEFNLEIICYFLLKGSI
jgi:hypothetical protein